MPAVVLIWERGRVCYRSSLAPHTAGQTSSYSGQLPKWGWKPPRTSLRPSAPNITYNFSKREKGESSQLCPAFCAEVFPIFSSFFLFAGSVIFLLPSQTKFFLKLHYCVVLEEISYVIKNGLKITWAITWAGTVPAGKGSLKQVLGTEA